MPKRRWSLTGRKLLFSALLVASAPAWGLSGGEAYLTGEDLLALATSNAQREAEMFIYGVVEGAAAERGLKHRGVVPCPAKASYAEVADAVVAALLRLKADNGEVPLPAEFYIRMYAGKACGWR